MTSDLEGQDNSQKDRLTNLNSSSILLPNSLQAAGLHLAVLLAHQYQALQ